MAKYVYPAVFTPEAEGGYSIHFPDLEGCCTQGEDLADGLAMANDVLCLTLYGLEEENQSIPSASSQKEVILEGDQFVTLVACDTLEYRKFYDNKAVKKTLTIPSWLNTMAERQDINFSAVLQSALKAQLGL